MITIKLTKEKVFHWQNKEGIFAKGYLFDTDGTLYRDEGLYDYFNNLPTENDFCQKLQSANGLFSVIIQKGESVWIAVDRLRYFPLFYREQNNNLLISDEIEDLFDPEEPKEMDPEACLTFSGCSYVLGEKTLLKGVYQVRAGAFLRYDGNRLVSSDYHTLFSPLRDICFNDARLQLKTIIENITRRMAQLIGNRPVVLSLSGGYDSRLVAYLLKKAGIKKVLCYTFGVKEGNPEWERSRMVAERLGFDWIFIDYSDIDQPDFYKEKTFVDFYRYVAQYVSKFGFMQYFAIHHLIDKIKIPVNAVFFTGGGGDLFTGGHFRPYMKKYNSLSTIARDLQYIHCNLVDLQKKERKEIICTIKQELKNTPPLWENIENWDLKERQAKYILNANKLWEYFGVESQVPLCDAELMDFFVSLPFEYRLNQKLYRTVLAELFEEFDLNFPQDIRQQEKTIVQQMKIFIKRKFPFLRKDNGLFQYDYFDFKRFLPPVLRELQGEGHNRKILTFNGIFSEWYLWQVKKEVKKYEAYRCHRNNSCLAEHND
jgi:asparagine synthase (glutamine-hydrolysing)